MSGPALASSAAVSVQLYCGGAGEGTAGCKALPGHSSMRRVAGAVYPHKECGNGQTVLPPFHPHLHIHHNPQQQQPPSPCQQYHHHQVERQQQQQQPLKQQRQLLLLQDPQQLEKESLALSPPRFSLRRTAYHELLNDAPLTEGVGERRYGGGGGSVVASGLEGKSLILKQQPSERSPVLFYKPAAQKPLLGGDVLHVL